MSISIPTWAFMSGIDPNRDTQGEIEIIGATIPLAPPNASVNAGYVKFTNTSDRDVEFHSFTSPVYDSVEMHVLIPAKDSIELKPGGTHLMLIGPRRDVKAGEQILMIAQDALERRFMLKFNVVDFRDIKAEADHNHHSH